MRLTFPGSRPVQSRFISLDLLRVVMTVLVIGNHAASYQYFIDISPVFGYVRTLAVPIFLVLSSYLSPSLLDQESSRSVVLRKVTRLYTPVVVWGLFYFAAYWGMNQAGIIGKANDSFARSELTTTNILYQLLFGGVSNPALYYLVDAAWLTLLVYWVCAASFSRHDLSLPLLVGLAVLSLLLQYSGLNWLLFSDCDYRMRFTLGRFCEFLPFFSLGFLLRKYEEMVGRMPVVFAGALVATGCLVWSWHHPNGFGYSGIGILMGAVGLFLISVRLRFKSGTRFSRVVQNLSAVTLGVYCVHNLVVPACSALFRQCGFASPGYMPVLFSAVVILSFTVSFLLKAILGVRSKGVVS